MTTLKRLKENPSEIFETSLISELDFPVIKMLKSLPLNYPSYVLVNLFTQIALYKLNYLIFQFV